ncbi:MAG TPA: ATP-binding protein [Thermoguttaceae bacterium]|nr:ATP-binding protein [Thermoguttaceae bacterium]
MREMSLHILDIIENAVRAGASAIIVTFIEDCRRDTLQIIVEDDGPGLKVPSETALDPFFTTKNGKRTGLGLSLLQSTAEQANGQVVLRQSALGGLAVEATVQLSHIDRIPLGDITATVSSVVCTNPELDLLCRFVVDGEERLVRVPDVARELPIDKRNGLAVARQVAERIRTSIETLPVRL